MTRIRRRVLVAVTSLAAAALVLPACSNTESSGNSTSQEPVHAVTVHGVGIVEVTPDVLQLVFGAEGNASSVKDAMDIVAKASTALTDTLKSNDVDKKDIQSSQINLSPIYDYSNSTYRITGYTASINITAKLRKPDKAGDIISQATDVAGNALRLRGMSWIVDDPSKSLEQARTAAMEDAKDRAVTLTKAGDAKLGDVISINESSQSVAPPVWDGSSGDKGEAVAPAISIEAGTETITVNVDVVYALD